MPRFSFAVVLVAAVAALAAAPQGVAGTVTADDANDNITFSADAGEANRVFVVAGWMGYRVVDSGAALTAESGCVAINPNEAFCLDPFEYGDSEEDPYIALHLGDLADFASVTVGYAPARVYGEGGDDVAEVDAGHEDDANRVDGGEGDDKLVGYAPSLVLGGAGDDELSGDRLIGGPGADVLRGNVVDYSERTNPVAVDPDGVADDGEPAEGDNVRSYYYSRVLGGAGADTLSGFAWSDGGGGDDVIVTSGHCCLPDTAYGGSGDDVITGGGTYDSLYGAAGDDVLSGRGSRDDLRGGLGNDVLRGGGGRDRLAGGSANDTFYARDHSADRVLGGRGRDRARVDYRDVVRSIERIF